MKLAHSHELGGDLLRRLSPLAGDSEAIEAELTRWLDLLGVPDLAQVLLAAVQRTFSECLTVVPLDDVPAGALTFHATQEATR